MAPLSRREREERRKQRAKAQRRAEKRASTRSAQEAGEVAALEARLAAGAPPPGTNPLALDASAAAAASPESYAAARTFEELPLSRATRDALKAARFTELTAIQRATLPHALAGRDVLGAAKTGSGKTLCFLIPVSNMGGGGRWGGVDAGG